MDDMSKTILSIGLINTYGQKIEEMNVEFIKLLDECKIDVQNCEDPEKIADKFHRVFLKYSIESLSLVKKSQMKQGS